MVYRKAGKTMLFRRLVVWNSTILVFLTAVFVWYNLTSTQKIVEEEVYNSFYTSMDTGAAELTSVFRDARNLTLELCANTSVQRALRQDEEQKIQTARQSSENLTRFFPDLQCGNLWPGCRTSAVWRRQYQKHFRGMAAGGAARAGAVCMGLPLYRIRLRACGFPT